MLGVRTKPTELVVSGELLPWHGGDVMATLIGLCFASIDEKLRPGLAEFMCDGCYVNQPVHGARRRNEEELQ